MSAVSAKAQIGEQQLLLIARALADPRRYYILKQLAASRGPCTPCATMRECVEITPGTLSHHMRELRLAGLVSEVREGRSVSYELCREVLATYLATLRQDLL